MSTRTEKIRTQITGLLSSGEPLTHQQIASVVGVCKMTVQRVAKKIKPDMDEVEEKLAEYRRLLGREMPIGYRARRLKELAEQDSQLMVSLKALERADTLDGLAMVKDMPPPVPPRQPLFNFPPGTRMQMAVTLDSNKPEVIEATAEEVVEDK